MPVKSHGKGEPKKGKKLAAITGKSVVAEERFPVVALGASAGGLEAFEQFFKNLRPNLRAAFVVISHLDPRHSSMLSELISRFTQMEVHEALDGVIVEPGHVYVIPPNRDMAIFHGRLLLSEQKTSPGTRMPIDSFFRSLAEDAGDRAVAVILSGTGTDGTLGVRSLQAGGGVVFVQEPSSAKFDGMPRSAIQKGLADYVLPAEEIPGQLATLFDRYLSREEETPDEANMIRKVLMIIRAKTGHDFSQYKKNTLSRRIRRRISIHNLQNIADYVRYLGDRPEEVKQLLKEMLINVTNFFRDPEAFEALTKVALPEILRDKPDDYLLRVWVAGCATGEEAYSIAMAIREHAEETGRDCKVQIFATDLDETSIAIARAGMFPANIALDVPRSLLGKFFLKEEKSYRVRKDIRDEIVFAVQDVAKDAPFTRLDLVSCRNVLIYMEPELQEKLLGLFHYSLKPGGVLLLGSSESVGARSDLFRTIDRKWKFFQAKAGAGHKALLHEAFAAAPAPAKAERAKARGIPAKFDLEATVHRALLSTFAPPAVIVDTRGNILYIHGDTAKYLTPASGRPVVDIEHMMREGLRFSMRTALMSATAHRQEAVYRNLRVRTNGESITIDLTIRPLPQDEDALFMFTFQEVREEKRRETEKGNSKEKVEADRFIELEKELVYTRESLQATAEEAQAANEELKSANEELQSSNEELQSTNEELETSREELQSVNEELTTVNAELRSKIDQLSQSESDLRNLLDGTGIATIFLDGDFNIKRFNFSATRIVNLIPSDVGRPIDDVTLKIESIRLSEKAGEVIDRLRPFEAEVEGKDNAWFLMRIMPYRTVYNVIDGVVMTFADISELKRMAAERSEFFENIVQTVREPLLALDAGLRVVMANKAFLALFHVSPEETEGRSFITLGGHEWNIPALTDLLSEVSKTGKAFENFIVEVELPVTGRRPILLNARRIKAGGTDGSPLILLAMDKPVP
ncbi:MAG TPA: chemotaxis protein CheB [Syntrophorhabdaceae bacterium]|jgi:two-component system CheB/CheR fusion protein